MEKSLQTAENIRKFNRFYLPYFNLLTQKYLNSAYSLTEARILYELYENQEVSARDIANKLHIDKGYLSRIMKKFEANALVERKISAKDFRITLISLTTVGKTLAEELMTDSNCQIEKIIKGLSDDQFDELSYHFGRVIEILGGNHENNGVSSEI